MISRNHEGNLAQGQQEALDRHPRDDDDPAENAENAVARIGRLSREKLNSASSAPPVNTHPYTLPPARMPARFLV